MLKVKPISVLLIEDEEFDVRRVRNTIKAIENKITITDVVSNGHSALELIASGKRYDVVIMDFQISGGLRGEELIRKIKALDETLQIIVITKMTMNTPDFAFASELINAGASWFCTKYPGDIEAYIYQPTDFILSIINAFERKELHRSRLRADKKLQKNIDTILTNKCIIGESPVVRKMKQQIAKYAATKVNVLILGASGTGKELVATNIHYHSPRRIENFVPINCGSLPPHLVESELFGFEKGAFTGADTEKRGLFEVANGGTIFLDEITELPLSAQSKLLRVIQEGEIDKIGRTEEVRVDVRIIAATNKDLLQEVHNKTFRQDLFYRLNVGTLQVPTLRQRETDVLLLADHFLSYYSDRMGIFKPMLTSAAKDAFLAHHWPGNIRELQNVVQRLLLNGAQKIDKSEVDACFSNAQTRMPTAGKETGVFWEKDTIRPWREMETDIQKKYFTFVRENSASDAEAARLLGLAPPNFYRMCKKLGIK
ncbi:sigma-54-dependent Fis family transcriptional regulator [candidate division KSB1 bacterium]|nr:sigma-54-dependent Fis family transcriptional regulator [candidate division KSB1 bacterium]